MVDAVLGFNYLVLIGLVTTKLELVCQASSYLKNSKLGSFAHYSGSIFVKVGFAQVSTSCQISAATTAVIEVNFEH